jgi:RimJ/RimL family protein N-acetyltransferase
MQRCFDLEIPGFKLSARELLWDSLAYGSPVVSVENIYISDKSSYEKGFSQFREWLDCEFVQLVSCRLLHNQLRESMFLEASGFRFIEMILHPICEGLDRFGSPSNSELRIESAGSADLETLTKIARNAFKYERFHVDPRIESSVGSIRYSQWVEASFSHPSQRLIKITDRDNIVGFFILEECAKRKEVIWHLTAVSPTLHGLGYGKRIWNAMLCLHRAQGFTRVSTSISARNSRILNLYSYLNFRFSFAEMTFHWVRSKSEVSQL